MNHAKIIILNLVPALVSGLLLVTALTASGCASAPYEADEAASLNEVTPAMPEIEPVVEREAWLSQVSENLSHDLCEPGEVFRSCYDLPETDCHARVRHAATSCEYQLWDKIPEALNNDQGQALGAEIGRCTGDSMSNTLNVVATYIDTPQCQRVLSEL